MRGLILFFLMIAGNLYSMEQKEAQWASAAVRLVDKVMASAKEKSPDFLRRDFFIPRECQTESGLILECEDEGVVPVAVHTPIGTWKFVYRKGCDLDQFKIEDFLNGVKVKEYYGDITNPIKRYLVTDGKLKLYSVSEVDELLLPNPTFREIKDFTSLVQSLESWGMIEKMRPSRSNQ